MPQSLLTSLKRKYRPHTLFAWQPSLDGLTPYRGEGAGTFTRNSIATYTTDAGVITQVNANVARYQDGGILLEPQRSNLVVRSNHGAGWSASGTPVVTTGLADPMGGTGAFSVQDDSDASYEYVSTFGATVTPETAYAFSVFLKKNASAVADALVAVNIAGGTPQYFYAFVDPRDGSLGTTGSPHTATSVTVETGRYFDASGHEWFRVVFICTPTAGNVTAKLFLYGGGGTLGSGGPAAPSAGDTTVWFGAQIEAGSYPTTYIPTNGAAVTRNADLLSIPFTEALPSEGMTVLWRSIYKAEPTAANMIGMMVGTMAATAANEYGLRANSSGGLGWRGPSAAAEVVPSGGPTFTVNVEDDIVAQVDVANATVRTFNASDVAQSTAAITVSAGLVPEANVVSREGSAYPHIQTALLIVRGLLTPAQMRRLLRA